jgi:predicted acyl esterase
VSDNILLPTGVEVRYVFLEGHSIRPEVSNSNFPGFNSNPNTGHKVADDSEMQVANRYVFHDCARMSHVLLPVIRS